MIHAPLARHLTRFSRVSAADAALLAPSVVATKTVEPTPSSPAKAPVPDVEARIAEACMQLREALAADHAAALDAAARRHDEALAAMSAECEARLECERGQACALEMAAAVSGLEERLAVQIAKALRPMVEAATAVRATAALVDTIAQALADPDRPALVVRGPAARIAAIEAALGNRPGIGFERAEHEDLVVTGATIRIETRLAAALEAIAGGA